MVQISNFNSLAQNAALEHFNFIFSNFSSKEYDELSEEVDLGSAVRFFSHLKVPHFNGLIQKAEIFTPITDKFIKDQIDYFNFLEVSHIWWLTTQAQHESLGPLLTAQGYSFDADYLVYAADPLEISKKKLPNSPENKQIKSFEVTSSLEYEKFIEVFGKVFSFDAATLDRSRKAMKDYGEGQIFRHFYATFDDQVVGVATILFKEGSCSIWNGGVLPEYRKKGLGRVLALKILEFIDLNSIQAVTTILMADAQAKGLCGKFAASEVGKIYPYFYGLKPCNFEPK